MTSDERRDVAENLRDIDGAWPTLVDDLEEDPLRFGGLAMAGILACVDDRAVFRRLANLIDPTCEDVSDLDRESFKCSRCGYRLMALCQDPSGAVLVSTDGLVAEFQYCPNCGARVVRPNGD